MRIHNQSMWLQVYTYTKHELKKFWDLKNFSTWRKKTFFWGIEVLNGFKLPCLLLILHSHPLRKECLFFTPMHLFLILTTGLMGFLVFFLHKVSISFNFWERGKFLIVLWSCRILTSVITLVMFVYINGEDMKMFGFSIVMDRGYGMFGVGAVFCSI